MTKNEVIKSGEGIYNFYSNSPFFTLITLSLTVIIALFLISLCDNLKRGKTKTTILVSTLLFIICSFFLILVYTPYKNDVKLNDWKENIAYPYINSIESERYKATSLELGIDLENSEKLNYVHYTSRVVDLVPVEITYELENGETKEIKSKMKVSFDLNKNEEPYIEYVELTQDLGLGIKKGIYNPIIHVSSVSN